MVKLRRNLLHTLGSTLYLLDGRKSDHQRKRKRRLIGGEISAPVTPTLSFIQQEWKQMVEKGDLSLGVPCAPTTLTHYTTKNGQLEVREKLLKKHEDYMRLNTDDEIDNMGTDELKLQASHFNHQR